MPLTQRASGWRAESNTEHDMEQRTITARSRKNDRQPPASFTHRTGSAFTADDDKPGTTLRKDGSVASPTSLNWHLLVRLNEMYPEEEPHQGVHHFPRNKHASKHIKETGLSLGTSHSLLTQNYGHFGMRASDSCPRCDLEETHRHSTTAYFARSLVVIQHGKPLCMSSVASGTVEQVAR